MKMILPTRFTNEVSIDVAMSFNESKQVRNMTVHQYIDEEFEFRASMLSKIFPLENTPKAFNRRIRVDDWHLTIKMGNELRLNTSFQTALAHIIHLLGQYQFFHRYSQAHDCPYSLQASYISVVCSIQTCLILSLEKSHAPSGR